MKLRQLTHTSDTHEMLDYLKKRHPLYFTTEKINDKQITDLINRLKFRLKQAHDTKQFVKDNNKVNNVIDDKKNNINT